MLKLGDNDVMTGAGKAKHLIVVSYDAFSEDNWELAKSLPNLSELIKHGAFSTKLKSVYPTLTYVAHTTMVTGVYPDKHGVFHNNPLQPFIIEKNQRWFWYRDDIKVPTIYDMLKKAKLKSAGLLWPVTGKSSIDYNIPEIRAIGDENQIIKALKNGSPLFSIEMEMKFGRYRRGIEQPYLDDFTTMCAVHTIKRKKPNLLLVHLIDLDDAKHADGTDSNEVKQAIIRMDKRLGDIMHATEEAGINKDTVLLVIGDHGQINVRYKVRLNKLLRDKGLIYTENGKLKWRAYVQNAGGAAYLHIKQGDEEAEVMALGLLETVAKDASYGIEKVYTEKDLMYFHVAPSVKYMLEAKKGYCFEDGLEEPVITDLMEKGIRYATHGYSPDKPNYRCNLIISGDCIKNEYQIGDIDMVDIAPTMAKILGVDYNNFDGRPLSEVFTA
jgi:predicted AlkP superfamily pyrophosphatase or phosphodiesterase